MQPDPRETSNGAFVQRATRSRVWHGGARPVIGLAALLLGAVVCVAQASRVILLNLSPLGTYSVTSNALPPSTRTATPQGSMLIDAPLAPGDTLHVRFTGVNPFAPSALQGLVATGDDRGCAVLAWDAPPASDYVDGYRLYWTDETGSVADSADVSLAGVSVRGQRVSVVRCGFASGAWTFRARARNQFKLWGPVSAGATTTITNGSATGPLPPFGLSASEPSFGCVALSWKAPGDPSVAGYRMYIGIAPGSYSDSLDAGSATSAQMCGLGGGRWYLSVRSYDAGQVLSAFASEISIQLQGVDDTAPVVSGRTPADGAVSVARNASVTFRVADDRSGVDSASVSVTFNGVPAGSISLMGTPSEYTVQANPAQLPAARTTVVVEVNASDRATPANAVRSTWTYTTGDSAVVDVDPPVIAWLSPRAGSVVASGSVLSVEVRDAGLGLDLSRLSFEVDGAPVSTVESGKF